MNDDLFHNIHNAELISKKQEMIYKILSQIQNMVHEYKSIDKNETAQQHSKYGGSIGILRTAMEVYVTDLLPEIDNLRRLKHELIEMEDNVVFKQTISLHKLDLLLGEPPSILRFRGV
jgi:hypothetical protein